MTTQELWEEEVAILNQQGHNTTLAHRILSLVYPCTSNISLTEVSCITRILDNICLGCSSRDLDPKITIHSCHLNPGGTRSTKTTC